MTEQEKREKVIEGLEMSYRYANVDEDNTLVPQQLVLDALALLKAQEPMLVVSKDTNEIIGDCPRCGRHVIHWHNKYCAECGQAVKWE